MKNKNILLGFLSLWFSVSIFFLKNAEAPSFILYILASLNIVLLVTLLKNILFPSFIFSVNQLLLRNVLRKYKKFECEIDGIEFKLLKNIGDFKKEAEIMNHCLWNSAYHKKVIAGGSVIMVAINKNDKEFYTQDRNENFGKFTSKGYSNVNSRATIEIKVYGKLFCLNQLKSFDNFYASKEIRGATEKFCEINNIEIATTDI